MDAVQLTKRLVIVLSFFFSLEERKGGVKRKEGEGPGGKRGRAWAKCCAGLSVFSPYVTSFFRTPRLTISNFIYWFLEKKDDSY